MMEWALPEVIDSLTFVFPPLQLQPTSDPRLPGPTLLICHLAVMFYYATTKAFLTSRPTQFFSDPSYFMTNGP